MMLERPPAEWLFRTPGQNFVLIHGLAMAPAFWRLYAPEHVREHNTVAYTLPGHYPWNLPGPRGQLSTDAIMKAYAQAIEEDFDGKPVTLVGHSTGGFISLLLAAHRPDLVRSVVIMGGFACGRFEGRERMAARLLRVPGLGPQLFATLFRRWISTSEKFRYGSIDCVYDKTCPWENPQALEMMEMVRAQLLRAQPDQIRALVAWFQRTSHLDRMSDITTPVLNLIGVNDAIVPPSHQLRLSRLLPNVQTVLFGNSGHLLMVERQAEMDRIFARFAHNPFLQAASAAEQTPRRANKPVTRPVADRAQPRFSLSSFVRRLSNAALSGTKVMRAHL